MYVSMVTSRHILTVDVRNNDGVLDISNVVPATGEMAATYLSRD